MANTVKPLTRSLKSLTGQHVVFTNSKNDRDPRIVQKQLVCEFNTEHMVTYSH